MIRSKFVNNLLVKGNILRKCRHFSDRKLPEDKIRNIAILAHIDAGKTTTTERMLYYSGKTRMVGEVHHGNTVTDFLSQERERGITICSAAVTLPWENHRINLLDTPGHIDFTMEVEQSLSAVDGVVIILDSSSGVEVQTVTVWHQADHYDLPRMVFANKMDRSDGNFEGCLNDLKKKLDCLPVPLQQPIIGKKGINGIVDVIDLKALHFGVGKDQHTYIETSLEHDELTIAIEKRCEIVDLLSGHDDDLANEVISSDSLKDIKSHSIKQAIRNLTAKRTIVPVLLGSAFKNIGIQPLLDGIVSYLPSPSESSSQYDCFGKHFAGKVFKVMHDKKLGALSLVRVLNGTLAKGDRIRTPNKEHSDEIAVKIFEPLADEYSEIPSVSKGNVGICAGLKTTSTGDILVSRSITMDQVKMKLNNAQSTLQLKPQIPDPVFFCSIEPPSMVQQQPLETALEQLHREDPSLRIFHDEHTMQTVLSGMGELHLEIVKSRLLSEYKIDADIGPIQIAYQETIQDSVRSKFDLKKEIQGINQSVEIEMSLETDGNELFKLDVRSEDYQTLQRLPPKFMKCIKNGVYAALERGPLVGGKVVNTHVVLHAMTMSRGTAEPFLTSATSQSIKKLLQLAQCRLLEPLMSLQIVVPNGQSTSILGDLAKRRAEITDVFIRGENKFIYAIVPLSEMTGFSKEIRKASSGTASVSMQPAGFAPMVEETEARAIRIAKGLE